MPRLLIALTFILCSTALAEKLQRPTGFLGVPFGAAPAEVVRVLGSRGGATLEANEETLTIVPPP